MTRVAKVGTASCEVDCVMTRPQQEDWGGRRGGGEEEETGIGRLQVMQARMQSISFAWPTLKTLTRLYVQASVVACVLWLFLL